MTSSFLENHLSEWLLRKTAHGSVRRAPDLSLVLATSVGLVRSDNQDRVAAARFSDGYGRDFVLVALADGMGGMADGAVCAATTLAAFFSSFIHSVASQSVEDRLLGAVLAANVSVYKAYKGSGGATLSAVLFEGGRPGLWINVGDSRIYRFHRQMLDQLTVDDTLAGQLAREPAAYLGRNELLQFVGVGPMVEPHLGLLPAGHDKHQVILTSDGIHFLPNGIMLDLLFNASDPSIAARRLLDLSAWCGGRDNASLAIIAPPSDFPSAQSTVRNGTINVCDPYGEIRFLFDFAIANQTMLLDRELPSADKEISGGTSSTETFTEKKRRISKSKKSSKKSHDHRSPEGEKLVEVPQLVINFPKKSESE